MLGAAIGAAALIAGKCPYAHVWHSVALLQMHHTSWRGWKMVPHVAPVHDCNGTLSPLALICMGACGRPVNGVSLCGAVAVVLFKAARRRSSAHRQDGQHAAAAAAETDSSLSSDDGATGKAAASLVR